MANVRTRKTIDNAGADAVIAAAERHANENGYRVVIAVVDPSGELIATHRTEGAQVASSRVAVDKARTAAIFIRPSREMEEQVTGGRLGALALHGASCLTGGIPLKVDGEVVGAALGAAAGRHPDRASRRGRRRDRRERRVLGRRGQRAGHDRSRSLAAAADEPAKVGA